MLQNKLVRRDGSVIDSSVIISCEFTEEVNGGTNLTVGNATASELIVEMRSTSVIEQGEEFTYYIIEDGVETKIGVFTADKPTRPTKNTIRFSAYDNIVKTEIVFSDWLRDNQDMFPIPLISLVNYACLHSGVVLAGEKFPNFDLRVEAFYADNITCRQILMWASEIAGMFVRANADGALEFAWYVGAEAVSVRPDKYDSRYPIKVGDDGEGNISITSDDITLSDDGNGNVTISTSKLVVTPTETGIKVESPQGLAYFGDSLSYEEYYTDKIQRVQINHSESDVGVIYPQNASGNCFTVSDNMILGTMGSSRLNLVATDLYTRLKGITYVPLTVRVPRTIRVRAGDIISVVTSDGRSLTTYVMKVSVTSSGTSIESTGDKSHDSNVAVASQKYANLTGKVSSIERNVDGVKMMTKDLAGNYSDLHQDINGIGSRVGTAEGKYSELKQTVDDLTTRIADAEGNYSQLQQNVSGFTMTFQTVNDEIQSVNEDLQNKYNERVSYIRFEDGNIILGKNDSEIMLIQKNDRISFVRNVEGLPELAYFSNDVLHVTEGQFMVQLGIGNFGFRPGANGNLSFKKVVT